VLTLTADGRRALDAADDQLLARYAATVGRTPDPAAVTAALGSLMPALDETVAPR
jgi:hypothetical protein